MIDHLTRASTRPAPAATVLTSTGSEGHDQASAARAGAAADHGDGADGGFRTISHPPGLAAHRRVRTRVAGAVAGARMAATTLGVSSLVGLVLANFPGVATWP